MKRNKARLSTISNWEVISLTSFLVITSLTYCIHLPTRLLGDDQICLGPVCQRPHHFPLGLWACKKICFPEPNCIHHPSTNDKTSPVMIEWNNFPPFTLVFTVLTFFLIISTWIHFITFVWYCMSFCNKLIPLRSQLFLPLLHLFFPFFLFL